MELTYKVRGGDGNEYGPVTVSQLQDWAREGRLNAQSELQRNDMAHWASAGQFSELASVFPPIPPPAAPVAKAAGTRLPSPGQISLPSSSDQIAMFRAKASGRWFYWIAGLSLINTVISLSHGGTQFVVGLGVTQIFDAMGHGTPVVPLLLDALVAGLFVMLGVFAQKRQTWAFVVGMVLYGLDAVIFLMVSEMLAVGFHVYVLFWLVKGFMACRSLSTRA